MSEKSSEGRVNAVAVLPRERALGEVADLLRRIAGAAGSEKARIGRAATRLRWAYSRTKDLWYADPRCAVRGDELDQARARAGETPQFVECDLDRLEQLEREVAELRSVIAQALARVEGRKAPAAQRRHPGPREGEGRPADAPGLRSRALARPPAKGE